MKVVPALSALILFVSNGAALAAYRVPIVGAPGSTVGTGTRIETAPIPTEPGYRGSGRREFGQSK